MIPLYEKFARGGWLLDAKGSFYTCGDSPFYGSFINNLEADEKIIASAMKGKNSYIILTSRGNIHTAGESRLSKNVYSAEYTNTKQFIRGAIFGDNLAMLDSTGNVYLRNISKVEKNDFDGESFSIGNVNTAHVKEIVFTNSGKGLYVLTSKGKVNILGDAIHYGDLLTEKVSASVVSMAVRPWGDGYWILDSIGGIFCYGECDYFGSIPGDGMSINAVKIKPHSSGRGYWVLDRNGNIFPFGYADIIKVDTTGNMNEITDFVPEEVLSETQSLQGSKSITSYLFEYMNSKNESDEKIDLL